LEREIGRKFSSEEKMIAGEISFLAGYHPLSLALTGGYIKAGNTSLKDFRNLLRKQVSEERVVGLDSVRELSITRSLDYIYQKLSGQEKFCLRALSIVGEDKPINTKLVTVLCKVEPAEAESLLSNLAKYALLAETTNGQFAFSHLLVLEYARRISSDSTLEEQAQIKNAYENYLKLNADG
jgi:hypothetical protein